MAGCEPREEIEEGHREGVLILSDDQAWISGDNNREGFIFTPDGRTFAITREGTTWKISKEGIYIVEGNKITLNYGTGDSRNGTRTFKISSDGRTVTGTDVGSGMVLIRTSGVNVKLPPSNPGTGGKLTLDADQAWINKDEENMGIIFRSNNTAVKIKERDRITGTWEIVATGTYLTNEGVIIMTIPERTVTGTYTVSGNNLVVTFIDLEGTKAFTKRSGITIITPGSDLVGDWTPNYRNEDGVISYPDNDPYKKTIISFRLSGEVSWWGFEKIDKVWVETPFEDGDMRRWAVKDQTIYLSELGADEKVWGTYEISGGQLTVSNRRICTADECKAADILYEETFTRVDTADFKNTLDGTIYISNNDAKIRGTWVKQDAFISFGKTDFEENPRIYGGSDDYEYKNKRYYTTDNRLILVFARCEYGDNECLDVPRTWNGIYSISDSGDTLTITNNRNPDGKDIWTIKRDDSAQGASPAERMQNKRPSPQAVGKRRFPVSAANNGERSK